jgi:hypothetical protein
MTSSAISLFIKRVASLRTVYYLIEMYDSALVYDLKVRHLLFPVAPLGQPNWIRGTVDSLIITGHIKAEFYDECYDVLFSRVETTAGACERMGERSWSSYHRHVRVRRELFCGHRQSIAAIMQPALQITFTASHFP